MNEERRYREIEVRAVGEDDKKIIEGYAVVYDSPTELWGITEIIRKGAATEALKKSDEFVLWNHEASQPMARRKNGTLEVKEDDKGVYIKADVSGTEWGRKGYEAIKSGVTDKMSFAFTVKEEEWKKEEGSDDFNVREITKFEELFDYSPVTYPAYQDTDLTARKNIAFRNKPEPGAPGDGTPAGESQNARSFDLAKKKLDLQEKEL